MNARPRTILSSTALLATLMTALAPVGTAGAAADTEPGSAPRTTTLTFAVEDCEGCEIQLTQARRTLDADAVNVWTSRTRTVSDGTVTFRVASRRTHGMSVTVRAPWEGHTGYATTVAWRYAGKQVGDPVTFAEARTKKRASACWEGTRRQRLTVPLVVERVRVAGVHERVPGSIAFVPETQSWLAPMRRTWKGVLGSQDVNICG